MPVVIGLQRIAEILRNKKQKYSASLIIVLYERQSILRIVAAIVLLQKSYIMFLHACKCGNQAPQIAGRFSEQANCLGEARIFPRFFQRFPHSSIHGSALHGPAENHRTHCGTLSTEINQTTIYVIQTSGKNVFPGRDRRHVPHLPGTIVALDDRRSAETNA